MSTEMETYDSGAQATQISSATIRSPFADAWAAEIDALAENDVKHGPNSPIDTIDPSSTQIGEIVGITDEGNTTVAAEGDGALTTAETLKDRGDSVLGPQWGEGRTTWHPRDVRRSPPDHNSRSALSAIKSERHKKEVRRLFGPDSWLKRVTDGTYSDDDGNRHASDVRLRLAAFCKELDFQAYESETLSVYKDLPAEPFQPIGGHEPAECQASRPINWVISDVHPPENGKMDVATSSEYSWDLEYTPVKHDPITCPYCHRCRCGNYHLGEPPKNGVETQILAAMLVIDERRIKSSDKPQEAFNNRLQKRDGYNQLVTRHALKSMQALQTARKHYKADE